MSAEGVIAEINDKGIKLKGQSDWLNFTKPEWREEPWDDVDVGDSVELGLDKSGKFIRSISATDAPRTTAPEVDRNHYIVREVAIKTAFEYASHFPWGETTGAAFTLAQEIEDWILRDA